MLRTLIIIRHAKAAPSQVGQSDFDRRLTDEGLQDAVDMAHRLQSRGLCPDKILASAAKRTAATADVFARAYERPDLVHLEPAMYNASAIELLDVFQQADLKAEWSTVLLVAHNPGITYLGLELAPSSFSASLPTCGMLAVQADTDDWAHFLQRQPKFSFFDYPKNQAPLP